MKAITCLTHIARAEKVDKPNYYNSCHCDRGGSRLILQISHAWAGTVIVNGFTLARQEYSNAYLVRLKKAWINK